MLTTSCLTVSKVFTAEVSSFSHMEEEVSDQQKAEQIKPNYPTEGDHCETPFKLFHQCLFSQNQIVFTIQEAYFWKHKLCGLAVFSICIQRNTHQREQSSCQVGRTSCHFSAGPPGCQVPESDLVIRKRLYKCQPTWWDSLLWDKRHWKYQISESVLFVYAILFYFNLLLLIMLSFLHPPVLPLLTLQGTHQSKHL